MYNLIQLYLNNNIHGVPISDIIEKINADNTTGYFTNGFWIGGEYYACIRQLFELKNNTANIKKSTKCPQIIQAMLNENVAFADCNCNHCLAACINNIRSLNPTLKIK